MEVLLVTSRKGKRWVIPKGIVEPGLSAAESAVHEAWEEAGVKGRIRCSAVGSYLYDKWGRSCSVAVFILDVDEEVDTWPEGNIRRREWVSPAEAASRVREEDLRAIILGLDPSAAPGEGD